MVVCGAVVCGWLGWVLPTVALDSDGQDKAQTSQHDHAHGDGHGSDHAHDGHGGDADGMDAMMATFMKMAAPGEHHAHLKALSGRWNAVGKFRMDPSAPFIESKSEGVYEWILGGRFLKQQVKGEPMMGMPAAFEGFGILGYDNMSHKHTFVWMDNMGTMTMSGEGECTDAGKVTTYMSKFTDPMSGQESYMKSVYRIEGPDRYVLEMYSPGPEGKEFLAMELVNTRKK